MQTVYGNQNPGMMGQIYFQPQMNSFINQPVQPNTYLNQLYTQQQLQFQQLQQLQQLQMQQYQQQLQQMQQGQQRQNPDRSSK